MNNSLPIDEFASDNFVDTKASAPTLTVLNHETRYGYFLPVSTLAKIDWINFDEKQLVEHTYRNKTKDKGILITNPRMLCVAKTDPYQFDADKSKEQKKKVIVGLYDAALKGQRNIKTERIYLVFFLDKNNNFLHNLPLKYAARGANGASFDAHRRAFRAELESCHASAAGIALRPKNDRFHSLGVFCFETAAEMVGEGSDSSWVCRVVSHEKPKPENWKNYFLGYSEYKDHIWEVLDPDNAIDICPSAVTEPYLETAYTVKGIAPQGQGAMNNDDDDFPY